MGAVMTSQKQARDAALGASFVKPKTEPIEETKSRVVAGSVGAVAKSFAQFNEDLRVAKDLVASGEHIVEIDPALIDASFAQDRMADFEPDGADAGFVSAIQEQGQLVPVLLRRDKRIEGRYQPVYGRRRIAAASFLGRKVRAVVRELNDEQLVVAQGQENEARNPLTFIEKCRFAATLEKQGFSRKIIESALSVDKSDLSRMLHVVAAVPEEIIDWVGPAAEIGSPRWMAFVGMMADVKARARAKQAISREKLGAPNASSERFLAVLAAASAKVLQAKPLPWRRPGIKKPYGALTVTPRRITLVIDRVAHPAIAELALERFEDLRREIDAAESRASTPNHEI
jgi:ParB family transcriptional regulator, chromosome partitioning protein